LPVIFGFYLFLNQPNHKPEAYAATNCISKAGKPEAYATPKNVQARMPVLLLITTEQSKHPL
jgi:hypothetical protein